MKQDIIALAAHRFDERGKRFKTLKPFYRNAKEFFLIGFLFSGKPSSREILSAAANRYGNSSCCCASSSRDDGAEMLTPATTSPL